MRPRIALGFVMTLVSCAGSVRESADDPAGGHPSAAAGSPAASLEDDRSGAGGSASGAAPAGPKPALVSSAGNRSAQPDNEHGGDAGGGGAEPALVGAAGAPDEAEVTRTLVDEPLLPRGFLSALQYRSDPDQASVYTIEAIFEITRGPWDGCTRVQLGDCWYYDCPPGSAPYLPSVPLQDAGALTVTTDSDPVTTIKVGLLYDFWYEADAPGELWPSIGKALTFSATGGDVPTFSIAVPSPPTVALTTLNGEAMPKSIARSDGAALRWTSTGAGLAAFSLYGFYDRKFAAVCEFDATANGGELPAVLLQELEPGSDYFVSFHGASRAQARVQGYQLDASLAGYGGPTSPYDAQTIELR